MKLRQLPLQRLGTPEEVANIVVVLASDLSLRHRQRLGRRRRQHPQHQLTATATQQPDVPHPKRDLKGLHA